MKASEQAYKIIKNIEEPVLEAYPDTGGVWTIGYGHTSGVYPGQTITLAQAETLFQSDIQEFEGYLNTWVTTDLTINQFDALLSLMYNAGTHPFLPEFRSALNNGDYDYFWSNASKYIRDENGDVQRGLEIRRAAEEKLFYTPDNQAAVLEITLNEFISIDAHESAIGLCTINGQTTEQHIEFSQTLLSELKYGENANSCAVHIETSGSTGNLKVIGPPPIDDEEVSNSGVLEQMKLLLESILKVLSTDQAHASELNLAYAGDLSELKITVDNGDGVNVSHSVSVRRGRIVNDEEDESPTLTLEEFEIDVARFLEDGDDPRVSYILSHDGDEDLSSVKLRWYGLVPL